VPAREQLRDERLGRLADLRDLDPQLALRRLHVPGPEPVALARRAVRPALVAGPAEPRVELLLDRPLDDQPGAEPGELRQHLLRILDQPPRQQLVDVSLYLRRWRYGASHGVGLLHRLAGLEGTYAVALTASGRYLQQFWDATFVLPGIRFLGSRSTALTKELRDPGGPSRECACAQRRAGRLARRSPQFRGLLRTRGQSALNLSARVDNQPARNRTSAGGENGARGTRTPDLLGAIRARVARSSGTRATPSLSPTRSCSTKPRRNRQPRESDGERKNNSVTSRTRM
jgi:hypothetical protein